MTKAINDLCFGLGIQQGVYVDMNGGQSVVYKLTPLNLVHADDTQLNTVCETLGKCCTQLPETVELKLIVMQSHTANEIPIKQRPSTTIIEEIKYQQEQQHNSPETIKELFVVLTSSVIQNSGQRRFLFGGSIPNADKNEDCLDQGKTILNNSFRRLKIESKVLETQAVFQLFQRLLFGETMGTYSPLYEFSDQLLIHPIEQQKNCLLSTNRVIKTASLQHYEAHDSLWFLIRDILETETSINYYVSFKKAYKKKQVSAITTKKRLYALIAQLGVSESSDKQSGGLESEFDTLLDRLVQQNEGLIDIKMDFFVSGNTESLCLKSMNKLRHYLMDNAGLGIQENTFSHLDHWISVLPNQTTFNPYKTAQFSDQVAGFFPLSGPWTGVPSTDLVMRTSRNTPFSFSFIDHVAPAGHTLVVGGTGGGKSFFLSWVLTRLMASKRPFNLSIIDMGGSYRKLCQLFGGNYILVEASKTYALQLFPPRKKIMDGDSIDADQLKCLSQYIKLLVSDETKQTFTKIEEHLINQSLIAMYKQKEVPVLTDFVTAMSSVKTDKETKPLLGEMEKALRLYTDPSEPLSCLFNSKTSLDLDNPFLVFDITRLKDHPQIAGLYLQVISNTLRLRMFDNVNTNIPQYIVRDEVWSLFEDPVTCKLISEEYRTARKYKTILFSLSQLLSDFTSENTNSVLKNSYTKIVLQSNESPEKLQELGLNAQEAMLASKVQRQGTQYSDVYLKYSDIGSEIIRVKATDIEYNICTLDPIDTANKSESEIVDMLKEKANA